MQYFSQSSFSVRLEWGLDAVEHLGADVECIVVVDIMSFSTCVSISVDGGALVYPYPWRDESAAEYGKKLGAEVASSKRRFADGYSLSPSSLKAVPEGLRLVLPSPNGSAASYQSKDLGAKVVCGCFRNLKATAEACRQFSSILVVPCGERWPDGKLRPCFEDYVAAGGIVSALQRVSVSPEARSAELAYLGLGSGRKDALSECGSALELKGRGFQDDVALCIEEDVSNIACILEGDHFVAMRGG